MQKSLSRKLSFRNFVSDFPENFRGKEKNNKKNFCNVSRKNEGVSDKIFQKNYSVLPFPLRKS